MFYLEIITGHVPQNRPGREAEKRPGALSGQADRADVIFLSIPVSGVARGG